MRRMSYVQATCRDHRKVYSGEEFPTLDRWFWICGCGETGSDKLTAPPELDPETYWRHMRKLKPDCWMPAKYRKLGI